MSRVMGQITGDSKLDPNDRYLSPEDVAQQLSLSTRSVRRLVESAKIPAYRLGRSIRIKQSDLDAYMQTRLIQAKEQPHDLKAMLAHISDRVLRDRKKAG